MELSGKKIAAQIENELRAELRRMKTKPKLAVILVGQNPASLAYIRQKQKKAQELGIGFELVHLPASVSAQKVLLVIRQKNRDPKVSGMIVQLPLPPKFDPLSILASIVPEKDVDGLTPSNLGRLFYDQPRFLPATVAGVLKLLATTKVKLAGKRIALIGFTPVVNMPLALLLGRKKATIIALQEKELNLAEMIKKADIVISAVGKRSLIKGGWIKKGAVVIDGGITRQGDRLFGDVDFAAAKQKASFITPVPGGVGPLTVIYLLSNVVKAEKNKT